ncbi:MAG TPA: hypothetical protein VG796_18300 [Verrucomicrobiales bacterium]|nr:hypothetical protein [Verrucomicrobiales bacterium]
MTSNTLVKWFAAGCFLFAGITALCLSSDPIIRWLGGALFVLMGLHGVLRIRLESTARAIPPKPRQVRFVDALTIVIGAGWLALTLLKQMYGPATLFFVALVYNAHNRLRGRELQKGADGSAGAM